MNDRLRTIETPFIDAQTLLNLFADYRKPRERILRMVKNEELICVKQNSGQTEIGYLVEAIFS